MPKLNWNGDDFRNPQDSSGAVADTVSRNGNLQQGYNHGSLTRGLVAYYPMDSGSGSTATEKALNNDGTINGASWSTDSKLGEACLKFDGTDDYVDMGVLPLSGSLTVSCWMKASEFTGGEQQIVGNYNGGQSSQHYQLRLLDDTVEWVIDDGSTGTFANVSAVTTGSWYHVVGVFRSDISSMRAYVDGAKNLDRSYSGSIPDFQTASTRLGTRSDENNWNFHGSIDDVRIYDRALSTPEVKALYSLERPSKVSPDDTLR